MSFNIGTLPSCSTYTRGLLCKMFELFSPSGKIPNVSWPSASRCNLLIKSERKWQGNINSVITSKSSQIIPTSTYKCDASQTEAGTLCLITFCKVFWSLLPTGKTDKRYIQVQCSTNSTRANQRFLANHMTRTEVWFQYSWWDNCNHISGV